MAKTDYSHESWRGTFLPRHAHGATTGGALSRVGLPLLLFLLVSNFVPPIFNFLCRPVKQRFLLPRAAWNTRLPAAEGRAASSLSGQNVANCGKNWPRLTTWIKANYTPAHAWQAGKGLRQYGSLTAVIPAKAGIQRRLFRGNAPGFPLSRE